MPLLFLPLCCLNVLPCSREPFLIFQGLDIIKLQCLSATEHNALLLGHIQNPYSYASWILFVLKMYRSKRKKKDIMTTNVIWLTSWVRQDKTNAISEGLIEHISWSLISFLNEKKKSVFIFIKELVKVECAFSSSAVVSWALIPFSFPLHIFSISTTDQEICTRFG